MTPSQSNAPSNAHANGATGPNDGSNALSTLLVTLLKGVIARDEQETRWQDLLNRRSHVQEYVSILGLELIIAEEDGYAFLRQRQTDDGDEIPRLIPRRPLSYPVSLLLALLRRRVAEHDATNGDVRVVVSVEETAAMLQPYLQEGPDEAKRADRLKAHLNTIAKLGFIRFLRGDDTRFEVRRLINAFVTAEWLAEFEARLRAQPDTESAENGVLGAAGDRGNAGDRFPNEFAADEPDITDTTEDT